MSRIPLPDLPPAVLGMLATLPFSIDHRWTQEDLETWMAVFKTLIRYEYRDFFKSPSPLPTVEAEEPR